MPNEITAVELAREMCWMNGQDPDCRWSEYLPSAHIHLLATRAYAALQAQPTEAPGRVKLWHNTLDEEYTTDPLTALGWIEGGCPVIEGHFIPDTEAHE